MRDIVRGKHCLQHEVEHAEEESDHDIDDDSLDECALLYEVIWKIPMQSGCR